VSCSQRQSFKRIYWSSDSGHRRRISLEKDFKSSRIILAQQNVQLCVLIVNVLQFLLPWLPSNLLYRVQGCSSDVGLPVNLYLTYMYLLGLTLYPKPKSLPSLSILSLVTWLCGVPESPGPSVWEPAPRCPETTENRQTGQEWHKRKFIEWFADKIMVLGGSNSR
jgi:hypothetical protein